MDVDHDATEGEQGDDMEMLNEEVVLEGDVVKPDHDVALQKHVFQDGLQRHPCLRWKMLRWWFIAGDGEVKQEELCG